MWNYPCFTFNVSIYIYIYIIINVLMPYYNRKRVCHVYPWMLDLNILTYFPRSFELIEIIVCLSSFLHALIETMKQFTSLSNDVCGEKAAFLLYYCLTGWPETWTWGVSPEMSNWSNVANDLSHERSLELVTAVYHIHVAD